MTLYELLIPEMTVLIGIIAMAVIQIVKGERHFASQWTMQAFVLVLALLQEGLLYRLPSTLFLKGAMVLDGASQALAVSVLVLALLIHLIRRTSMTNLATHVQFLFLGTVLFALFALKCNRIFFGVISVLGMIWTSQAALAAETEGERQPNIVHSGVMRGLAWLVAGLLLSILCYGLFGDTQLDEIQKTLVRVRVSERTIYAIEVLVLFMASVVTGLPPFDGLFGKARRQATWSLSLGLTGIFAIVGLGLFIRWGLLPFTRPAIGGSEMEALTPFNIMSGMRIVAAAALVLIPVFAFLNRQMRGSFLIFMLNPFAQALLALSFGQREVFGLVFSQVIATIFGISLVASCIQGFRLPASFTLQDWVGLGRRSPAGCLILILGLTAAAGLSPFFGSVLVQKTLSINSPLTAFSLLNAALAGFYVARLTILAFHRGSSMVPIEVSGKQKLWFAAQLVILIFMGILWQPLYKYGAFSVKGFFGEL